ncbi:MAG: hypothetical protein AAFY34_02610 [Pseudomonadota bacterium]
MLRSKHNLSVIAFTICLAACTHRGVPVSHDFQTERLLGGATAHNIAAQSIRPVDLPNSAGLTGQSGERAVTAITRLNTREPADLSDVSASGITSTVNE